MLVQARTFVQYWGISKEFCLLSYEYTPAATSPGWLSHPSRLAEPLCFNILCLILIDAIDFSHGKVFRWNDVFDIDFICIINNSNHDGICEWIVISDKTLIPAFFPKLGTKDGRGFPTTFMNQLKQILLF